MNLGHRRVLLRGPSLVGFFELFDNSCGDPSTPLPYAKVKPAVVGGVLLPFACPHCGAVKPEMVHTKRALNYKDGRGFSWCPACKKRYFLDEKGAPLSGEIEVGATCAPAVVERGGKITVVSGRTASDGLQLLGEC